MTYGEFLDYILFVITINLTAFSINGTLHSVDQVIIYSFIKMTPYYN